MLQLRLIFGTSLAVLVVAIMLADGWLAHAQPIHWRIGDFPLGTWLCNGALCTLLLLVFCVLAVRESITFAHRRGHRPLRFVLYFFSAGYVIAPYVSANLPLTAAAHGQAWGMFWLAIALAVSFLLQAIRRGTENVISNLATTILFTVYCGALLGFMVKLRMEIGGVVGTAVLLFSMFLVKMTDVGAFFTGLAFGRHKFIPWLSPKKTWEGVFGGVVCAIACAILVGGWLRSAGLLPAHQTFFVTPAGLATVGFLMAIFSIAGDLCESLLKRDIELKDSGDIIPGMGGILDVLDSPLLAAPVAWFVWTRLASAV